MSMAVGDNGTALLMTGGNWMKQVVPTTENLHGVGGPSSSDVYVVGDFGTVLRFNGTVWSEMNSGLTADLLSVVASPADGSIYAVGSFGTVVRFTGTNILPIETPYATIEKTNAPPKSTSSQNPAASDARTTTPIAARFMIDLLSPRSSAARTPRQWSST